MDGFLFFLVVVFTGCCCILVNYSENTSNTFTFLVLKDVWGKAAFIAHIGGILAVLLLDDVLEIVVDLSSDAHGFFKGAGTDGQDHELLHGKLIACMGATIDHIEGLIEEKRKEMIAVTSQ